MHVAQWPHTRGSQRLPYKVPTITISPNAICSFLPSIQYYKKHRSIQYELNA